MEIRTPPPHAHEGFPTRPNSLGLDPLLIELLKKDSAYGIRMAGSAARPLVPYLCDERLANL